MVCGLTRTETQRLRAGFGLWCLESGRRDRLEPLLGRHVRVVLLVLFLPCECGFEDGLCLLLLETTDAGEVLLRWNELVVPSSDVGTVGLGLRESERSLLCFAQCV